MPDRIQLRRVKGWRKPPNAVVVARPSRWGNPYVIGSTLMASGTTRAYIGNTDYDTDRWWELPVPGGLTAAQAVALYRQSIESGLEDGDEGPELEHALEQLAGRDLCCWCPLDQPCHADVLLELANRSGRD